MRHRTPLPFPMLSAALAVVLCAVLAVVLCACRRETTEAAALPEAVLRVTPRWDLAQAEPTGMTVLCYPADGSAVHGAQSSEVQGADVALPQGEYDVVVFSQIASEYTHQAFALQPPLAAARMTLAERTDVDDWRSCLPRLAADVPLCWEPQAIAADVVKAVGVGAGGGEVSPCPRPVGQGLEVSIRVEGIAALLSARATLYGLARSYCLGTASPADDICYEALTAWTRRRDDEQPTAGYLTARIATLGLPPTATGRPEDAELVLQLRLRGSEAKVMAYRYAVGHLLRPAAAGGLQLVIEKEADVGGAVLPRLPDVEDDAGSASGFDATIAPWTTGDAVVSYF